MAPLATSRSCKGLFDRSLNLSFWATCPAALFAASRGSIHILALPGPKKVSKIRHCEHKYAISAFWHCFTDAFCGSMCKAETCRFGSLPVEAALIVMRYVFRKTCKNHAWFGSMCLRINRLRCLTGSRTSRGHAADKPRTGVDKMIGIWSFRLLQTIGM